MIGQHLNHGHGHPADLTGHDAYLCQIGQTHPRQIDSNEHPAAFGNPTIDISAAALDRVHGDPALLGVRQKSVDRPVRSLIQQSHHRSTGSG
jgi:hypothetical protein